MELTSPTKYITYREADNVGELKFYILQKTYPHYTFEVSTYPIERIFPAHQISGYYLWICFAGTIMGNLILPSLAIQEKQINCVAEDVVNWFYQHRIIPQEKKYKKYKYDNFPSR